MKGYINIIKLLVDTNIIPNLVLSRANVAMSTSLFRKINNTNDSAYITASSATSLFYIILKETYDSIVSYKIMENILKLVNIMNVTESYITTALMLKLNDFEDCVQHAAAKAR